jgi:TIR domain
VGANAGRGEEAVSDVFISYKREDRARVETLYALLLDLDVSAWFDGGLEVGVEWERRIFEQIDQAQAMIVCWTFAAVSSHWVTREAKIGLERNILVPVMLQPCALVPPFDTLQAADLTDWDGAPDAPQVQKVLGKLEHLLGRKNLARNARLRAGGQKEAMVDLLRRLLVTRATSKLPPYTYKEAEAALRTQAEVEDLRIGEFDQHSLWGALDALAEQNRRRREPPLQVLVVSKDSGRPGRGYWQKHVFLDGEGDELEQMVFSRQLARVRAYKWNQDV